MALKPSLVFNWVMFLRCEILNGKFCSFLVRKLIRKNNTDNKVFKKEFNTKETRKKGIEKEVLQILVQFAETYLRECPKNLVLRIRVFFFSF